MFKLPNKSKYFDVDHEEEFDKILEESSEDLSKEEKNRLDYELKYVKKYNLYSLFLFLREIATLMNENSFWFCAAKNLSSSYIAYLLRISAVNPLELDLRPENYFNSFKVQIRDLKAAKIGRIRLKNKDIDRKRFEHLYGNISQRNDFYVLRSQEIDIKDLLEDYYGCHNVALVFPDGPAKAPLTGVSEFYPAWFSVAFLADNICQSNGITLRFPPIIFAKPVLECVSSKCAFFGIPVVRFLTPKEKNLTPDTDLNNIDIIKNKVW